MKRKNFYLLLDLSIDPPEMDQKRIDEAIRKKQSEWSKNRNHPSKAIYAKQCIGLIPEIRKIMADPELRDKEALEAKKILQKSKKDKFSKLDRHLDIRMSKGYITKEDIFKLAKLHNLGESDIRKRIMHKEEKKLAKIDKHLDIRMSKGYITEEEISKLAKMHGIGEENIRKRVKCPIKKGGKIKTGSPRRLDKSVEKVINDNLKIVDKSSLYEFLGISAGLSIEDLQKRVAEKREQILKIAKKDAVVTAGEVLIGHCMSVFKTNEGRSAYDAGIARFRLAGLNSDIDVAGMDGKVQAEFFEILIKTAIEFGMDHEEASAYIKDYCRKKKWVVKSGKRKKTGTRKVLFAAVAASVIILVLITGTVVWFIKYRRPKNEYQAVLLRVENQQNIDEKLIIIRNFVNSHRQSPYALNAEKKITEIQNIIKKRDFRTTIDRVENLIKNNNYEKAADICAQCLEKYSTGIYADKINQKIAEISGVIDDRDYEKLNNQVQDVPYSIDETIRLYVKYLKKHPEGKHAGGVKTIISDMSEAFCDFLVKAMSVCEEQKNWEKCVLLCDKFIDAYPDNKKTGEFNNKRNIFQSKIRDQRIFLSLKTQAEAQGADYQAAKQIYSDFLDAYPDSALKNDIRKELDKLSGQEKLAAIKKTKEKIRALLKETGGRFVEKKEGALKDTKTGLMWCMLDSYSDLEECLDYKSAILYVTGLKTGGYSDWRLPTVSELKKIYKTEPFFPTIETRWYWTSENYPSYSQGWSKVVDIVTSKKETALHKEQKNSRDCGTVRGVRP